jgi:hypothetical protein
LSVLGRVLCGISSSEAKLLYPAPFLSREGSAAMHTEEGENGLLYRHPVDGWYVVETATDALSLDTSLSVGDDVIAFDDGEAHSAGPLRARPSEAPAHALTSGDLIKLLGGRAPTASFLLLLSGDRLVSLTDYGAW